MGRIFDDRGNRMTPSHSNRDGIRYRYYVFHVLLQRRKTDAADSLGPRDFAASGPASQLHRFGSAPALVAGLLSRFDGRGPILLWSST
jgi:hypothetical protein